MNRKWMNNQKEIGRLCLQLLQKKLAPQKLDQFIYYPLCRYMSKNI